MSDYTPTTAGVRGAYARDGVGAYSQANANRFDRWLAAIIPNPADERQVESVARALHSDRDRRTGEGLTWELLQPVSREWLRQDVRVVLAALREAVIGDE